MLLIIFLILGSILKVVLDKTMNVMETKTVEENADVLQDSVEGSRENIEAEKPHQE